MARLIALLILALACSAAVLADSNEIFGDVVRKDSDDGDSIERQVILVDDLVGSRAVERVDPDAYDLSQSYVAGKDQSITIGGVYPYDRQLASRPVFKAAKFLTVNTEILNYMGYATIHCIQIVDLQRDGQNAVATVQKGGIGQREVSIKFKSLRGGKINYLVILWGQ